MLTTKLEKVLKNMDKQSLTQILVTSTTSIHYLTGLWVEPHERMIALYIDRDGKMILFGNEMFGITPPDGMEYIVHSDNDLPVEKLAERMKSGKLGIDKFWASRFLIGLMERRKDITPVLGSDPVDFARMYKDRAELEAMREASRINDIVVENAINSIKNGIKETELGMIVSNHYLSLGADCGGPVPLICFGANASDPHHAPNETAIKSGDCAVLDLFTPINRYWCDMTRTVFFESVGDEQRKVYELVRKANLAGIAKVRSGVPLCEIDKAARAVIEAGGYGSFFTHRLGHNIGLDCHEIPDVSSASTAVAKPGMVFSIEPGIYLPGQFGVRIEDLVVVTEDGCEVLNNAPKELQIVK
ncbi:MAG: Xaa-Pro peptidase family protein [Oscillospiraceae bacterium]